MDGITPITIDGINENIYAGFWVRLGSLLLDSLILSPFAILIIYLNGLGTGAYLIALILNLLLTGFFYNIYLVKKYGGTPGKLITGIKIIKTNGHDVDWKEAILRHIVLISLTIYAGAIGIFSLLNIDQDYYSSLGWINRQKYLMTPFPYLFSISLWLNNIWIYSEFIVLLTNKRKRAIHDYMAGTVIVRTKYIGKIRETMYATETNLDSEPKNEL